MTDPRSDTDPNEEMTCRLANEHPHLMERLSAALAAKEAAEADAAGVRNLNRLACTALVEYQRRAFRAEDAEANAPGVLEERLREIIKANPHFGDWDEWAPLAYNQIPVLPREVMAHVYGRHDDTTQQYLHCVLCMLFRPEATS